MCTLSNTAWLHVHCTHCACTKVCTMCTLSNTPWLLQEDGAWQRLGVTGAGNTWIRQMGAAFDKHSLPNTAPCHIPPILFLILRLCISYALLGWLAGRLEAVTPILRSGLKRVTNLKRLDPGLIRICSFQWIQTFVPLQAFWYSSDRDLDMVLKWCMTNLIAQ